LIDDEVEVRHEQPADAAAVQQLLVAAFQGPTEAELVDWLRTSPHYVPELTFVAERSGAVVGYVMLWHVDLDDAGTRHRVLCLGPIAVAPHLQRHGIGSALMRHAIEAAELSGEPLIVLEGSPDYYPRFGFRHAQTLGITHSLPSWAPDEASMVRPLSNYRPEIRGHVVYPAGPGLTRD
jgi:putative acetyltransferase